MAQGQALAKINLANLLQGLIAVPAELDREVSGLTLDSRAVQPGSLFLACQGGQSHGLDYAEQAHRQGAVAIAWEPWNKELEDRAEAIARRLPMPLLRIPKLARLASLIAARFYDFPSRHMQVVGITGTNGKTSVSHLLAQTLQPQMPCGIIGTLGVGYRESLTATGFTTPDAVTLQQVLAELKLQGAKLVAMEVSSHALDQDRAAAVHFTTAVFTNISRDHFDYHGNMENYAAAKQRLFHMPGLHSAVINLDDSMGAELPASLASGVDALVYTLNPDQAIPADAAGWVRADSVRPTAAGLEISLSSHWGGGVLHSSLLGRFNAANLLAVLLVLLDQGLTLQQALHRLSRASTVAGRMEAYGGADRPTVVIDYAHTPDALEKALQALHSHCSGTLWVVFGCGGDRDRGKRPQMGELAERLAHRVVLTDDNPRTEAGEGIIREILAGIRQPERIAVERDRARAIRQTIASARPGDLVLVAGKGHEDYQIVGRQRLHFSDQEQVMAALQAWSSYGRSA
ncbi:MAG: UDP-N-acetylmuramoyl-L-alanyl-D-glutamate--2,6-diaminopimelate ligase [Chromatiales bacterium]|jgi:UDP-N-acetylmuramoyl-L-alanyl-D-glutamate--2,6-diaminopimelate ligase